MAIAFAQDVLGGAQTSTTSASTLAVTTVNAVAAGNFLVCVITTRLGSDAIVTSVTDDSGSPLSYSIDATGGGVGSSSVSIISAQAPSGLPAGTTITFTLAGSTSRRTASFLEYSGVATSSPVDQAATVASGSTGTPTTNSITTTNAADLLIAAFQHNGGSGAETGSPDTGWTERGDAVAGASSWCQGYVEERIVSATSSYSTSFTPTTTSTNWIAALVSYKAAGGGTVNGTATDAATSFAGSATGAATKTGAATDTATSFAGAASGVAVKAGTATGATTFTGSASGASGFIGTAVGATAFAGAAVGTATKTGTMTGSVTFGGSAAAAPPPDPPPAGLPYAPVQPAQWPTVMLWVDFTNDPLPNGGTTVTDITQDLVSFSVQRGRQNATSQFDAGTASFLLDNTLGKYGPTYTQSPYYPNVRPMRWVALLVQTTHNVPYLFAGYADGWSIQTSGSGEEYVMLSATDAFKVMNLISFPGTGSAETTDSRISALLTACGFTTSLSGDTGLSSVPPIPDPPVGCLQHAQDCAATETGQFYVGYAGADRFAGSEPSFRFENRYHRDTATRSVTSQVTFTDDPVVAGEYDYEDGQQFDYDDSMIWTSAQVTDATGAVYDYTDATAASLYVDRTQTIQSLTDTPNEAGDQAAWLVIASLRALDQVRVDEIQVDPVYAASTGDTDAWNRLLNLEVSDRVTVRRTAPPSTLHGIANQVTGDFFIERIMHDVDLDAGSWTMTLGLSPVSQTSATWAKVGTMKLGQTGGANTAVLGY